MTRADHRRESIAINATFSSFLRVFGFRVSELVGRTFKSLGNDPLTHKDGHKWGTMTHEVMLADWEGSEGRYLGELDRISRLPTSGCD